MNRETYYKDHWVEIEPERIDAYEQMFEWRPQSAPLLEPAELLLDRDQVGRPGERVLPQAQPLVSRRALVVEGDARPLCEGELTTLQRRLAEKRPQQRRLPGPVGACQREPVASAQGERDPVEEGVATELLAEARRGQDGHRVRIAEIRAP